MTTKKFKLLSLALLGSTVLLSCSNDDDSSNPGPDGPDFTGTFAQQDQMARPAINTVFVSSSNKDAFNMTAPSAMASAFGASFEARLLALNPGYTTNALGLDAPTFSGVLVTDLLSVSKVAPTTFFDGTNVLTGRALADDVIDVELLLIFGGPTGADNAPLTSDNVDANDKTFSASFPYLATPW